MCSFSKVSLASGSHRSHDDDDDGNDDAGMMSFFLTSIALETISNRQTNII